MKKSKTVAIIQARMGSTRLPGKVLKNLLGEPMLSKLVKRVLYSKTLDEIVVATTTLTEDDVVASFCETNKINFFRGDALDVLHRYYFSAKQFDAKIIVRLTGDNPFIDPGIIDIAVSKFFELNQTQQIDYLATKNYPHGLNIEVFSFAALESAFINGTKSYEREHVTPFIYQNSDKFNIYFHNSPVDYSYLRLTVDAPEDFKLAETIYDLFKNEKEIFLFEDILKLFKEYPELAEINKDIEQKKLGE